MFPGGPGTLFRPVRSLIFFISVLIAVFLMSYAAPADPLVLNGAVQNCLTDPTSSTESGCLPICAPYILNGLRQGIEIVKDIDGPEGDAFRAWLGNSGCWDAATQQVVRGSDLDPTSLDSPDAGAAEIRQAAGASPNAD